MSMNPRFYSTVKQVGMWSSDARHCTIIGTAGPGDSVSPRLPTTTSLVRIPVSQFLEWAVGNVAWPEMHFRTS